MGVVLQQEAVILHSAATRGALKAASIRSADADASEARVMVNLLSFCLPMVQLHRALLPTMRLWLDFVNRIIPDFLY
jgi:hypothetical protein